MTVDFTTCIIIRQALAGSNKAKNKLREMWKHIENLDELIINQDQNNKKKLNNSVLLKIHQLLWNEITLEDFEWKTDLLLISAYLKGKNIISEIEFKVIISTLYSSNYMDRSDFPKLVYIQASPEKFESFDHWHDFVLQWIQEMSIVVLSLQDVVDIYKEVGKEEINEKWTDVINWVNIYYSRPAFRDELLKNSSDEELELVLPWIPWKFRSKVVNQLLEEELSDVKKPISWAGINKQFKSSKSLIKDFPLSVNVIGDRISKLPAQPLEMGIFEQIPSSLVHQWAPKFSYRYPETRPKIQIYFPGGRHIGHSAVLVKVSSGMILLDFGLSVVNNSIPNWLPLLEKVDAVLLTHAHSDHSGGLPVLLQNNKEIPIFGKSETKFLAEMLWNNTRSILRRRYHSEPLYSTPTIKSLVNKKNIYNTIDNFHEIKSNEPITILPNVEFTAHEASHLFGSVGYELNIGGKRLLYTGDFNADGTRIFSGANFPMDNDLVIFDGTNYGRSSEQEEINPVTMKQVLENSKRVLIPAFSLGRSQEMLFELKKLNAHKNWQIFITGMGGRIAAHLNIISKLKMKKDRQSRGVHVVPYAKEEQFIEKSIIITGQGMLQAGGARTLLDYTANDPDTSVVLCGYQAPYTLGFHLLNRHPYLKQKFKQQVFRIKMSGHTSENTLDEFINRQSGQKILVHSPEGAFQKKKHDDLEIPFNKKPHLLQ